MSEPYQPDCMDWTPEQALESALGDLREGRVPGGPCDQVVVIFRTGGDTHYTTRYVQAGMNNAELIALLEIQKARVMKDINSPA